jgi:hypothetical protein
MALLLAVGLWAPAAAAEDQARVRHVWPLFYGSAPSGKQIGEARRMRVSIAPSRAQGLRLGFFESQFFGTGSQWRAAGWMAAVVASLEAGLPLTRWRVSYDVPGRIDGPSAGGLMTSTLLSGIYGVEMLPKVTMTGTINPDGSIGPVGGIYHKLAGAQAKGMRKVLIPAGQRMEEQKDGSRTDLVKRGQKLGIEVVEVADVRQAFAHLTGKSLPSLPDQQEDFHLPDRARAGLEQSLGRWRGKFQDSVARMRQTAPQVPRKYHGKLDMAWKNAHALAAKSDRAREQGNLAAAAPLMFLAAVAADAGGHLSYLYIANEERGLKGALEVLKGYLVTDRFMRQFQDKLNQRQPSSLNDLMALVEAYAYYDLALGTVLHTQKLVGNLKELSEKIPPLVLAETVTLGEALARNLFYFVDDLLLMGMGHPGGKLDRAPDLGAWAKGMYQAAGANLGYIEKAVVEPLAQQAGADPKVVQLKILSRDPQYQQAQLSYQAVPVLFERVPAGVNQSAAVMGGAVASFAMSGLVVAKWYSLEAPPDANGMVGRVGRPRALGNMLASSRGHLRQMILAVRERLGFDPVMPIFHYRGAEGVRGMSQDPNDLVTILSEYWIGSTQGRLMLSLGGE